MIRALAALLAALPLAACMAGAALDATGRLVGVTGAVVETGVKVTGAVVDAAIPDDDGETDDDDR